MLGQHSNTKEEVKTGVLNSIVLLRASSLASFIVRNSTSTQSGLIQSTN